MYSFVEFFSLLLTLNGWINFYRYEDIKDFTLITTLNGIDNDAQENFPASLFPYVFMVHIYLSLEKTLNNVLSQRQPHKTKFIDGEIKENGPFYDPCIVPVNFPPSCLVYAKPREETWMPKSDYFTKDV